jgi:hypothetical protein
MSEMHDARPHCEYPDCSNPARTTAMALRVPGTDDSHVVHLCARHALLFEMQDPDVIAWIEASPTVGATGHLLAL